MKDEAIGHGSNSELNEAKIIEENRYMEHILDKVKKHFNLSEEAALIDLEIYLNRQNKTK